jgi:hypothetical protein
MVIDAIPTRHRFIVISHHSGDVQRSTITLFPIEDHCGNMPNEAGITCL